MIDSLSPHSLSEAVTAASGLCVFPEIVWDRVDLENLGYSPIVAALRLRGFGQVP